MIIAVILLWLLTGSKAQTLDVIQANFLWNYHGTNFQPNTLGNGWEISPEIRYYFAGNYRTGGSRQTMLYKNQFLMGAYFQTTWSEEWKRDSTAEYPRIVKGMPENGGVTNFNVGMSFKFIPNQTLILTLDAGVSFRSLYVKNGVRDSTPEYPYYRGIPIKFDLLYNDDDFRFFNRINLSLYTENSFFVFKSIKTEGRILDETADSKGEHFLAANLECSLFSPGRRSAGSTVADFSLINQCRWYNGTDCFGLSEKKSGDYKVGIGISLRQFQNMDEAIKLKVLFGQSGLDVGVAVKLFPLYDLLSN